MPDVPGEIWCKPDVFTLFAKLKEAKIVKKYATNTNSNVLNSVSNPIPVEVDSMRITIDNLYYKNNTFDA